MRPRITAALVTGGIILAAGGAGLVASSPASAHTPELSCHSSTIIVDLSNYPAGSTVGGTIDGVDLGSTTFGPDRFHYEQPIDTATEHAYAITVAGSDGQGDHTWTGTTSELCGVPITPTPTPTGTPTPTPTPPVVVTGTLVVTITPDTCTASVKTVTWTIPTGLSIGSVTGTGSAVDENATILSAATGGTEHPRSWILPVTVLEGFTYDGPTTITLTQTTTAPDGGTTCPTTPPTGEPTTPAPSDGPTSTPSPTDAPSTEPTPTAGTTPPASSSTAAPAPTSTTTATAVPVVDGTSTPDTLAYTGADRPGLVGGGVAAVGLLALGAFLLHRRHAARVRAIAGSDER